MRTPTTDDLTRLAKDAVYITVGLGVLTVQQLDARRHEVMEALSSRLGTGKEQVEQLLRTLEARLREAEERVQELETRMNSTLDTVQGRLPEPAGDLVGKARDAAASARTQVTSQVRGLVRRETAA